MQLQVCDSKIIYKTKTKMWSLIGVFILFSAMFIYGFYIIINYKKQFQNFTYGFLNSIIFLLLVIIAIRAIYFFCLDKDYEIEKKNDILRVNENQIQIKELSKIYISYYGNNIREDSCNVYFKLKNSKKIPIAINIEEKELDNLILAIIEILKISDIERKRFLFNF